MDVGSDRNNHEFDKEENGNENEDEESNSPTSLDGSNRFPKEEDLPGFRSAVNEYFEACAALSDKIARLMAHGLILLMKEEQKNKSQNDSFEKVDADKSIKQMKKNHTSYLRMNHYPPINDTNALKRNSNNNDDSPLGISPHTDAGFLTILMQDNDCHSLQVGYPKFASTPKQIDLRNDYEWITVEPVPGALTINTGDMAQIWSNGYYRAPLHRVLTNTSKHRYSSPFFYNPGYASMIQPLTLDLTSNMTNILTTTKNTLNGMNSDDKKIVERYYPCCWGYFRAVRFAGDLTDLGTEIQVTDFEKVNYDIHVHDDESNGENSKKATGKNSPRSHHIYRQEQFIEEVDFRIPFSVEKYRNLLVGELSH